MIYYPYTNMKKGDFMNSNNYNEDNDYLLNYQKREMNFFGISIKNIPLCRQMKLGKEYV